MISLYLTKSSHWPPPPGNNISQNWPFENFQIKFGNNRHKPERPMIYKLKMAKTGRRGGWRINSFLFCSATIFAQVDPYFERFPKTISKNCPQYF